MRRLAVVYNEMIVRGGTHIMCVCVSVCPPHTSSIAIRWDKTEEYDGYHGRRGRRRWFWGCTAAVPLLVSRASDTAASATFSSWRLGSCAKSQGSADSTTTGGIPFIPFSKEKSKQL